MARARRVVLQLLPQSKNVVINGASGRVGFVSPDLFQQALAGDDFPAMPCQQPQDFKFLAGQFNPLAPAQGFLAGKVYFNLFEAQFRIAFEGRRVAPQARPDAASNSRMPNGLVT
jgi:hypothetical protein